MVVNPPVTMFLSVFGFIAVSFFIMYRFRDKKSNRVPRDVKYSYEGSISNPKFDNQVNRNAFFHTKGNTYSGTTYGPSFDRRKSRKNK